VKLPWYQTFGNHDGLLQGNVGSSPIFDAIAVGDQKPAELFSGVNPCDAFETLRSNPAALAGAPARTVTADANRRPVNRTEYIEEMFRSTGTPTGHGFSKVNRDTGVAYWHSDKRPGFRLIGLDTVNPGGYAEGSIGAAQLAWFEARLQEVSSRYLDASGEVVTQDVEDKLIVIFSHHGVRSLTNPDSTPDPVDPTENDLPRVLGDEVEALVHRFPNAIAWVSGHTHENFILARPAPGGKSGFWDIGTAAHIDWSCQSRLIEVFDNRDGSLSIFCTMVDHAGHPVPGGGSNVVNLASIARELAANDFQYGFAKGRGHPEDRNAVLLIDTPFKLT
jgi:metallophosphoesterase (TIGR03767 family)